MPNIWNILIVLTAWGQVFVAAIDESAYVVHGIWKNVAVYDETEQLGDQCFSTRQYMSNELGTSKMCGVLQVDLHNEVPSITRFVWDALHSFSRDNDPNTHHKRLVAVTVIHDEVDSVSDFIENFPAYWSPQHPATEPAAICGDVADFRIFHLAEVLSLYKAELYLQGPPSYHPLFSSIASYLTAVGVSCHCATAKDTAGFLNSKLATAFECNARNRRSPVFIQPQQHQPSGVPIKYEGAPIAQKSSAELSSRQKHTPTWWSNAGRLVFRSRASASVRDVAAAVPPPAATDATSGEPKDVPVVAVATGAACGVAMLVGLPLTVWLLSREKAKGSRSDSGPQPLGTNESLWSVTPSTIGEHQPLDSTTPSSVDDTAMPADEPGNQNEWTLLTLASVNYGQAQNQHPPHMLSGVSPLVSERGPLVMERSWNDNFGSL